MWRRGDPRVCLAGVGDPRGYHYEEWILVYLVDTPPGEGHFLSFGDHLGQGEGGH